MKILYVTTISDTVNAFLLPHIKMLKAAGHEVDVAFRIEQDVRPELYEMNCRIYPIPFQRSPLARENFQAYQQIKQIISEEGYDLVHTHTPVASAIVRLVCRKLPHVRVFYSAHGFHFHNAAPLRNWLIYYPIEKRLARYTDTLITTNQEDYQRAQAKLKPKRVEYVPGVGLNLERFKVNPDSRSRIRQELNLSRDAFVLLSVGELNTNKNHAVIIKAIAELGKPDIHYLICGTGPLEEDLRNLSRNLGIADQVHLLGYRSDIPEVCSAADVFAFPSLREGLGMGALEAMACGLPLVTSNVHGIMDYSIYGETGYHNKPQDVLSFAGHIKILYDHPNERDRMSANNREKVKEFELANVLQQLQQLYVK